MNFFCADAVAWCNEYEGPLFHALLSDTPYNLESITKRFGKDGAAPARPMKSGGAEFQRLSRGFMNQDWDTDIAFQVSTWEAFKRVLHPGAFGFAFSGSRTWHRMAVAIEDAGFIIHPTVFLWAFGQGFPKSTRVFSVSDNSQFCQCDGSPRQWVGHDSGHNAHDGTRTDEDSQSDYQLSGHLHDAQLPVDSSNDSDVAPSQADAQEHIQTYGPSPDTLEGSEPSHSPSLAQYSGHPSSLDYSDQQTGSHKPSSYIPLSNTPQSKKDSDTSLPGVRKHYKTSLSSASVKSSEGDFCSGFPLCQRCGKPKNVFEGHRYGAQALKPAVEPILCFQKPYDGKPRENIIERGAGALNIDDTRLAADPWPAHFAWGLANKKLFSEGEMPYYQKEPHALGRWPANFILSHLPECANQCAPGCPVQALGAQSGNRQAGSSLTGAEPSAPMNGDVYSGRTNRHKWESYADNGGASRFFHNADWSYEVQEQIDNADAVYYSAKVGFAEREAGLTDLDQTTINDGREKSIDNPYQRGQTIRHNNGPCLKPIELTRYLSTLLLPPAEYAPRRILNPFGGTGSEAIGAGLAGWEDVVSIDLKQEYHDIAKLRWEFWKTRITPPKIVRKDKTNPGQMTLF